MWSSEHVRKRQSQKNLAERQPRVAHCRFVSPSQRIGSTLKLSKRGDQRNSPPPPGRKYHLLARICKLNMAQSERTSASSERRCAFNASVGSLLADPPRQRGSGWLHSFSLHLCVKLEGCIGWQWIKRADNSHGAPDWSLRMPSLQLFCTFLPDTECAEQVHAAKADERLGQICAFVPLRCVALCRGHVECSASLCNAEKCASGG